MVLASSDLTYGWAILLGIIQGITEFLPISSSGHLALVENFGSKGAPSDQAFDILLHLATVVVILRAFGKNLLDYYKNKKIVLVYLVVGSIPLVAGAIFMEELKALRGSTTVICVALIVTALTLTIAEKFAKEKFSIEKLGYIGCLLVGISQAIAITPGISRSGMTVSSGILFGLKREDAVKFSFLLMVPAVLGAVTLSIYKDPKSFTQMPVGPVVAGVIVAMLVGACALRIMEYIVVKRKLGYFAVYCALVGAGGLLINYFA